MQDDRAQFIIHAKLVLTVFALLDPPNKLLRREDTDLVIGLSIVASATACVWKLRFDEECGTWPWLPVHY